MKKEQFITVTHFINPQLFWYHTTDVPNEGFREIIELERRLQQIIKEKKATPKFHPVTGDVVAVKFLSWNKYIRGRVEEIVEYRNLTKAFIIWAIDYGFPFKTKLHHMHRIPAEYTVHISHIQCGSLAYILPAEKEFDFMDHTAKIMRKDHWNQRACDSLEKLITDAASVAFVKHYQTTAIHFWGDLKIVNHKGVTFLASDYLISTDMAIESRLNFREICLSLQTIQVVCWLSNNGNSKFKDNVANCAFENENFSRALDVTCDDFSKQKVEDWRARNEQVGGAGNMATPTSFYTDCGSLNFEQLVDDIEDSLSTRRGNYVKQVDTRNLDEIEEQGFMRQCGRLKINNAHAQPDPPPDSAFKINRTDTEIQDDRGYGMSDTTSNAGSVASSRRLSLRERRFLELRKKLMLKQSAENATSQASTEIDSNVGTSDNLHLSRESLVSANTSVCSMPSKSSRLMEFRKKMLAASTAKREAKLKCSESTEAREYVVANPDSGNEINVTLESKSDGTPTQESRIKKVQEIRGKLSNSSLGTTGFYKGMYSPERTGSEGKEEAVSSVEWKFPQKEFPKDVTSENRHARWERSQTGDDKIQGMQFPVSGRDELNRSLRNCNKNSSNPYDGITLLPAGFDLTRLNFYKDEENHWHRKKSTRNDSVAHSNCIPHDTSSSFSDEWNPKPGDKVKKSVAVKSKEKGRSVASNQNFRHTRAHTDKRKEKDGEDPPTKKQDDTAAPNIREGALKPIISEEVGNQTQVQQLDVTDSNPISFDSAKKYPSPRNIVTIQTPQKRRQLKSPAEEMDRIEQLLRHAELEKLWGNKEILNLSASNLKSISDPDSTDLAETSMPTYDVAKMSKENQINLSVDEAKLKKLAKKLHDELKLSEPSKSKTSPVTTYPQAQQIRSKIGEKKMQTSTGRTLPREEEIRNITDEKKVNTSTAKTLPQEKQINNVNGEKKSQTSTDEKKIRISTVITFPQAEEIRNISGEKKIQTKFIGHMVLAHSKIPQYPMEKLSEAHFLPEIREEMINMHATKVYRVQSYSWPHLLRGNSLFVINASRSGKTWSYLPSVCSLVAYHIRNSSLPQTYGPVAIILAACSAHVEEVNNFCRRLVRNIKPTVTVVPSYGVRNRNEAKMNLLNSCGILVVTPANLLRLFNDNKHECLIDPERVQHFVIDDLDLILSRSKQDFEEIMRIFYKVFKRSKNQTLTLQLVVTSRDWKGMMIPMIRCSNQPLLLMGDFLEAAVYGKAVISIKLRSNEKKLASVLKFIEQHPANRERLLIICNNDDDLEEVTQALNFSGYVCIGYGSRIGNEAIELRVTIEEWKKSKTFSQIIICCDASLPELQLQNVQNLIHYSMPDSWTRFTARFATLAHSYTDFVSNDFKHYTSGQKTDTTVHSVVLLDEENNAQLPRLLEFMKKHNQIENIHSNILAVAKSIMAGREELRSLEGIQLCRFVLEFGDCDEARCDKRHSITKCDLLTRGSNVPATGDMRIQILEVLSPTHYSACLLQHKELHSSEWRILHRPNELMLFGMKLNMHYTNMENCVSLWPFKPNDLCVCKRYDSTFHRARILEAPKIDNTNIYKSLRVTIKLIDLGTIIHNFMSDNLFVCEKQFADVPALAVDIRLIGVVPYDNERSWDFKSTKAIKDWILKDVSENECVHVNINSALAHTVWVNNVIVMERLPTIGHYIYRLNLRRSLIEKGFAVINNDVQTKLLALKEEFQQKVNGHEELQPHGEPGQEESTKDETGVERISPQAQEISKPNAEINSDSLKQKEAWCSLPLLRLAGVEIGDEKDNGSWTDIYMQCIDEPHMQQFKELNIIINDHIQNVRESGVGRFEFDVSKLALKQNCLVRYDSLYCRAKLYGIFGNELGKQIYRFFLCDFACFATVDGDEISRDFLYETTPQIVQYTPYQAVHCKLAGINIKDFARRYCVVKDYLYACAVRERSAPPQQLEDFQIRSYDILLYECENENDFSSKTLFNKTLLEYGIAEPDSKTSHFLEITPLIDVKEEADLSNSKNCEKSPVINFKEFIDIFNNASDTEQEALLDEIAAQSGLNIQKNGQYNNSFLKATETEKENNVERTKLAEENKVKDMPINTSGLTTSSYSTTYPRDDTCCEALISSSLSGSTAFRDSRLEIPSLKCLNKRPQTEWYETDFLIVLAIFAPDIKDYYLEVTRDALLFSAVVNNEKQVLVLHFLGTIKPQLVSHEIRGLKVIVRLVKTMYMKWPRLLQQTTKFPWFNYNYDVVNMDELDDLQPQQNIRLSLEKSDLSTDSNELEYSSEEGFYENYPPIINSEDILDPTTDIY